jgi:BRCA1/BRCA2-containing complex subunit 3
MISNYSYCKLVRITVDAYTSCLNHALLTQGEEVMGLLLGNVENRQDNTCVINIFSTICLSRKCKAKDRVEFDEIQIAKASEIADSLQKDLGIEVNVVGWYHSHPKITIPPSQVDLNTQFSQQYQGSFVGLIISCFSIDNTNLNKINLIAFQAKRENNTCIPLYIDIKFIKESDIITKTSANTSNSAKTYCNILKNLLVEEEEQFSKELSKLDKDDYLNNVILYSNRQILLSKIIQNISTPYVNSITSEIDNLKNFIDYMKDINSKLNNLIRNYKDINSFKDDDI